MSIHKIEAVRASLAALFEILAKNIIPIHGN